STTSETVDTSSSPYAVYKYGGSVYLVVKEDGNIVSVKVNTKKAKADDPVKFEVGATSVYFPVKDTYYDGISTNELEDFIYFVREVKDSDTQKLGTVIEAMRPDGSENFVVSMTGQTETIEAVRDGLLFYRSTEVNETKIRYTNLHNMLMEHSASYKHAQDAITDANKKTTDIAGTFPIAISRSITSTYAFRADKNSNEVFFVGVTSSGMTLYQNDDGNPVRSQKLCSNSGTPQFIKDGYLYFAGSSSDYYRVPLFDNMEGAGEAQLLAQNTSTATFGCDYAAGYFTYYAEVDQWATGYAYFVDLTHEGAEPIFVGQRADSDIPSQEQIDEAKGETE
ncbi:MAG: hypothetical protein K2I75_06225, partial [Clostridiales bacterium]|nr:hypothetical protein [Clostridiales bacterium]